MDIHLSIHKQIQLNLELQKELSAEKDEKEKLKQKNLELERRINMLHNVDNELIFEHDNMAAIKQEYIKTEIKSESE